MKYLFTAFALLILAMLQPVDAAVPYQATTAGACSASPVLNAIGDALTSGSDAQVLGAALGGERRLAACGNDRDVIGLEMIAADAYGDTNKPGARCSALRDARKRAMKLGDWGRVRLIAGALLGCNNGRPKRPGGTTPMALL